MREYLRFFVRPDVRLCNLSIGAESFELESPLLHLVELRYSASMLRFFLQTTLFGFFECACNLATSCQRKYRADLSEVADFSIPLLDFC